MGLHFLSFWPFRGRLLGPPPQVAKNGPFAQRPYNGFISAVTGSILQFLAFWAFISLHFGLVGLHFLAFWPCGPSFPFILAFSGSASGPPPTSCQKWPVCPTSLQWIYQRRDRLHFAVFSILGLHFLAFWPCGPSFPCILALWAFISLHFGLVGLHFLSFWPFRGRLLGPPPPVAKNGPFAQRPYNGFISAVTGSILQFLAFWAFIYGFISAVTSSILQFSGSASGVPPTSCQKWSVCPTSLQWIYQRRDRLHFAVFSILGLHFLAFWPCGPSFPCILALWAFSSLHFGLVGLHFLAFWPCGPSFPFILAFSGSASGPPPTSCQKWSVCPTSLQWIYQRRDRLHFAVFSILGLHFLAFWPCGPLFPCILAFSGSASGPHPTSCQKCLFAQRPTMDLSAP